MNAINTVFFALELNSIVFAACAYYFEANLELSCTYCITYGKTALNFPAWEGKLDSASYHLPCKIPKNASNITNCLPPPFLFLGIVKDTSSNMQSSDLET